MFTMTDILTNYVTMFIAYDNVIIAVYVTPTFVIYVAMLVSLLSIRRTLHRSVTIIYLSAAVVNVFTLLEVWITIRLLDDTWFFPYFEWMNTKPALTIILRFLVGYILYAQNCITVLMTLDRYLAICYFRIFERWQKWVLACGFACFASTFALHFYMHYNVIQVGSSFMYNNTTTTFAFYSLDSNVWTTQRVSVTTQAVVGSVCMFGCAAMNIRSLIRLRQQYKAKKQIELSFFIIGCFTFFAEAANVVILCFLANCYWVKVDTVKIATLREVSAYTLDALSLGPGICTLLVRGPIRKKFFAIVRSFLKFISRASLTSVETLTVTSGLR